MHPLTEFKRCYFSWFRNFTSPTFCWKWQTRRVQVSVESQPNIMSSSSYFSLTFLSRCLDFGAIHRQWWNLQAVAIFRRLSQVKLIFCEVSSTSMAELRRQSINWKGPIFIFSFLKTVRTTIMVGKTEIMEILALYHYEFICIRYHNLSLKLAHESTFPLNICVAHF